MASTTGPTASLRLVKRASLRRVSLPGSCTAHTSTWWGTSVGQVRNVDAPAPANGKQKRRSRVVPAGRRNGNHGSGSMPFGDLSDGHGASLSGHRRIHARIDVAELSGDDLMQERLVVEQEEVRPL